AVFSQHFADTVALRFGNVNEQQILRGRQADFRFELLNYPAQAGLQFITVSVFNTAVFHEQAEEIFSIELFVPAVDVALLGELERTCSCDLETDTFFEFLFEPRRAAFFQDVFQARMFAVGAITEIAMDGNHAFRGFDDAIWFDETNYISHARKR